VVVEKNGPITERFFYKHYKYRVEQVSARLLISLMLFAAISGINANYNVSKIEKTFMPYHFLFCSNGLYKNTGQVICLQRG
jgi:hypothetical protein